MTELDALEAPEAAEDVYEARLSMTMHVVVPPGRLDEVLDQEIGLTFPVAELWELTLSADKLPTEKVPVRVDASPTTARIQEIIGEAWSKAIGLMIDAERGEVGLKDLIDKFGLHLSGASRPLTQSEIERVRELGGETAVQSVLPVTNDQEGYSIAHLVNGIREFAERGPDCDSPQLYVCFWAKVDPEDFPPGTPLPERPMLVGCTCDEFPPKDELTLKR